MKFEQSYLNKEYVEFVLTIFEAWTFFKFPSPGIRSKNLETKEIVSYHFYTLSHPALNLLWNLFITTGKKSYKPDTIQKYLNFEGFSHWIMCDGSLNRRHKYMTLHTEGFSKQEQLQICVELNQKFGLHSKIMKKNKKYWMIYIPKYDVENVLCNFITLPHFMAYKLPVISQNF